MVFSRTKRALLGLTLVTAMLMMLGMVSPQTLGDAEWAVAPSPDGATTVQSVDFVDETVGYAAMGPSGVMRTTDGGDSWETVLTLEFAINAGLNVTDVCFIDASTGWAVGLYSYLPIIPLDAGGAPSAAYDYYSAVYYTDDAGENWERQVISGDPAERLNAISFYGDMYGMAVGENQTAAVTRDGGSTWTTLVNIDMPSDINDVFMTSSTTAQIVGNAGLLGEWKYSMPILIPGVAPEIVGPFWSYSEQISGSINDLTAVTFTDADRGFATCEAKYILQTSNGGDTWSQAEWSSNPTLYGSTEDIQFTDADRGWAVGYSRPFMGETSDLIFRTTDGGANWVYESPGTSAELYTIDMVSDSCGFAMGETGAAYKFGATNTDRLSGDTRYETAMATSQDAFADNSSNYVVVATGLNFADALSASGLAGAYECPLLITGNTLSSELTDEIDRVGASNVVLIGGPAAIPEVVETDLDTAGYTVTRIQGDNRYDTSAMVADEIKTVTTAGDGFHQSVFIARGDSFADALAISPFAYSEKNPVLLVRTDSVPVETEGALIGLNIQAATLVGGTAAISADTMDDINDIIVNANSGMSSDRWSGANRYETAAVIAQHGIDAGFADASYIGVATGMNFPDALGGGVVCGRRGGVLLLTSPTALSPDAEDFITTNMLYDTSVRVFGGESAVAPAVTSAIEALF
ncbi:MAG: cell wall-binding repeat-containing protein [Actinomycetota bacterium]|nr:cell wall-binding repeat-containing protein [Actinomycetota bacterium]